MVIIIITMALELQGLRFEKKTFPTKTSVKAWLKEHKEYKPLKKGAAMIDSTQPGQHRVRILPPESFVESSYKTVDISGQHGVSGVFGKLI